MVNVAIIGLGRWGKTLVDSVQGQSDVIRFIAGVTRTPAKAAEFAESHGFPLNDDYAAVLADQVIDAVALATPHSQHAQQVIAAAEAGKHIFVEKPFTLSKGDAEKAVAAARQAGIVLALGHNRRFLPAVGELRRRLGAKALGQIFHVETNFSSPAALSYQPGMWRTNSTEVPSGGMTGMGIHMIDQMIDLFGPIVQVHARSQRRVLKIDIDDTTSMLFHFENGISGYLGTFTATSLNWRLQVFGSKGWAEIRDESRLEFRPLEGEAEVIDYPPFNTLLAEFEAFAAAISSRTPYPVSLGQAVHGIAVLEAVNRSASSGQTITVA